MITTRKQRRARRRAIMLALKFTSATRERKREALPYVQHFVTHSRRAYERSFR